MGRRTDIDWEACERDYRLGKTDQEVADLHGVSRSAVARKAKKEGWTKDLSQQVKLQTKAFVSKAIVEKATETLQGKLHESAKGDATAVEIEAISNALMIAEHERAGTKGRHVLEDILDQIGKQVKEAPDISALLEMAQNTDDLDGLTAGIRKVLSIPSYVDSAKKAMEGIAKAIDVERKARNLDSGESLEKAARTLADAMNPADAYARMINGG